MTIKFLSAFFAFINSILLARLLGIEGFSIYILAFTTVTILSIPVSLGLPFLITKTIPKYELDNNENAIKGLLIRANQTVCFLTIILLFLYIITYFLWWKNFNEQLVNTLWYSFILIPLLALGSLRAAALRGLRFIILGQLPDTLLRNLFLIFGIGFFFIFDFNLTPVKAILIHVIAATLAYIIGYVFLKIKLLNKIKLIKPTYYNRKWFRLAIPFSLNSGIQIIKTKLLTYILVVFGTMESIAIFDVAIRGSTLVAFTLDALNKSIAPYISRSFEMNDMELFQKIITKTSRIIFITSLPILLIFIFGGNTFITRLFGEDYSRSYLPLIVLCIGQLINAFSGSVGLILYTTGHQSYIVKVTSFMAIINVVISIPLVIYFDVMGAAISLSSLLIIQNIILVIYVKTKLNINSTII